MVKFRYDTKGFAKLIGETMTGVVNPNKVIGYIDEGKLNNPQALYHNSLYLVCTCKFEKDDVQPSEYSNPLAIVALNEMEAVTAYNKINGTDNATVMGELERHCDKLEVEPF